MFAIPDWSTRLLAPLVRVFPHEQRAVLLAFACHFLLFSSYYILKPVRDTLATVFGADALQYLFTGTFIGTLVASPLYAWAAAKWPLRRLLPGVLWFWLLNILLFEGLMQALPGSRMVAGAYYIWFSVVNLYMVSVFWSLMADTFTASQAPRLFGFIAAGSSTGAIAGSEITARLAAPATGLHGMLLIHVMLLTAAAGFLAVIAVVYPLMREKERLAVTGEGEAQRTTLDHSLKGGIFDGFMELMKGSYARRQAGFMLLMTSVSTVAYFVQTDLVGKLPEIDSRVRAINDIAQIVNVLSLATMVFGLPQYVQRFGVTAGLLLNPLIMVVAFVALALSPTLLVIQSLQVLRQAGQYAIARPSREMCFTVVPQEERYRTKNVLDTVVYRGGDLITAWLQAGLRALGTGMLGSAATGVAFSAIWGVAALLLGRRYEQLKAETAPEPEEERPRVAASAR